MRKQTFSFYFKAPPEVVYRAMLDPEVLPKWRVPDDMTMEVHRFEPWNNGKFRITLIYDDPKIPGKSGKSCDTYHGYFKSLILDQKIIEVIKFEGTGSEVTEEMVITTDLYPDSGGTKMIATHENLPMAVPEDQNELGWKMSLNKLAALLQG